MTPLRRFRSRGEAIHFNSGNRAFSRPFSFTAAGTFYFREIIGSTCSVDVMRTAETGGAELRDAVPAIGAGSRRGCGVGFNGVVESAAVQQNSKAVLVD